jgi:hypothetical protein
MKWVSIDFTIMYDWLFVWCSSTWIECSQSHVFMRSLFVCIIFHKFACKKRVRDRDSSTTCWLWMNEGRNMLVSIHAYLKPAGFFMLTMILLFNNLKIFIQPQIRINHISKFHVVLIITPFIPKYKSFWPYYIN